MCKVAITLRVMNRARTAERDDYGRPHELHRIASCERPRKRYRAECLRVLNVPIVPSPPPMRGDCTGIRLRLAAGTVENCKEGAVTYSRSGPLSSSRIPALSNA